MASQIMNGIDSSEKVAILDAGAQYGKVGVSSVFICWFFAKCAFN